MCLTTLVTAGSSLRRRNTAEARSSPPVRGERVSRGDAWAEPGTRPTGCKIDWEAGGGDGEGLGTVEDVAATTNGYVVTVRSVAAAALCLVSCVLLCHMPSSCFQC
jgi:hypothetical protein